MERAVAQKKAAGGSVYEVEFQFRQFSSPPMLFESFLVKMHNYLVTEIPHGRWALYRDCLTDFQTIEISREEGSTAEDIFRVSVCEMDLPLPPSLSSSSSKSSSSSSSPSSSSSSSPSSQRIMSTGLALNAYALLQELIESSCPGSEFTTDIVLYTNGRVDTFQLDDIELNGNSSVDDGSMSAMNSQDQLTRFFAKSNQIIKSVSYPSAKVPVEHLWAVLAGKLTRLTAAPSVPSATLSPVCSPYTPDQDRFFTIVILLFDYVLPEIRNVFQLRCVLMLQRLGVEADVIKQFSQWPMLFQGTGHASVQKLTVAKPPFLQSILDATNDWEGILGWDFTTLVAVMVGSNYTSQLLVDIGGNKAKPVKECLCGLRAFRNEEYGHISKSNVPEKKFHKMKTLIMNYLKKMQTDIADIAHSGVVDEQNPLWEVVQGLQSTSDELVSAAKAKTVRPKCANAINEMSSQESVAYEGKWDVLKDHLSEQIDGMSELLLDVKDELLSDGDKTRDVVDAETAKVLQSIEKLHRQQDDHCFCLIQ